MVLNKTFLDKARDLDLPLIEKCYEPIGLIEYNNEYKITRSMDINILNETEYASSSSFILDFGEHHVGYLSFEPYIASGVQDAPLYLKLNFGEHLCEFSEGLDTYKGRLGAGWLQEKYMHLDHICGKISLKRRYAFRYVKINVLACSKEYKISFKNISVKAVSSASMERVSTINIPKQYKRIDMIAIKTLHDCMQSVFEDGPKRDRRLWIGDLKLQALTNYYTFNNINLVKRSLYLLAGQLNDDGSVPACIYQDKCLTSDYFFLQDYSLLFISCVYDYYKATGDINLVKELWEVVFRQAEIAVSNTDEDGVLTDHDEWWSFIDWNDDLNKQAPTQGVLIYSLKQCLELSKALKDQKRMEYLENAISKASAGAIEKLWDEKKGFFVSGKEKQISYASQIFMILAEVFSKEQNAKLIDRMMLTPIEIRIKTPYLMHYLVEAMFLNDREELGEEYLKAYWGGMANDGADCFWEAYEIGKGVTSPYGSLAVLSYCHAWSCTPSYFIRKFLNKKASNLAERKEGVL